MTVKGYIEGLTNCMLIGWVQDDEGISEPILIEVSDGNTFYRCKSIIYHQSESIDSAKNDGRRSFSILLPDGVDGEVYVLLDHTGHRIDPDAEDLAPLLLNWLDEEGICLRPNLLVHRLFRTLRGRYATPKEFHRIVSDAQGLFEIDHLVRVIMTLYTKQKSYSVEDLVQEIYLGVINRRGNQAEVSVALDRINSGIPLYNVIEQIVQASKKEIIYLQARTLN